MVCSVDGSEVVLFMLKCPAGYRLTANRVMLCARNQFLLENMRDMMVYEYNEILAGSGSADIVREKVKPVESRIGSIMEWYDTNFKIDYSMHYLYSDS